jgi:hypothetical protein
MKAIRWTLMPVLGAFAGAALAVNPAPTTTTDGYLKPHVRVGEQITDVYSKSVSWSGDGLRGHVARYSGTSTYTITAVRPDAIVFDELDRSDGQPPSPAVHGAKVFADGNTWCYQGKCRINGQTSGVFFIPLLWGVAPDSLHAGSAWRVEIDEPWEIGPKGTEQVRVVDMDAAHGAITLVRRGSGTGPSSDELRWMHASAPVRITTTDGNRVAVALRPGNSTWSGRTTIRRGVIVSDEIMVTQQVAFVAKDGKTWNAELRAYTLLNLGGGTE